ncbi:hypothetical protein ACFPZ0_27195, partial [Streptomonospora nanhaiensis]|uniref:hypothetical protein n=1 Tax=Streptomonospora nanhaiensis TaxID=1323731 RepID=UPI0036078EF8
MAEAAPAARTATFAPPQEAEVKVSGPSWRRGALRSAGPPPEPEPVVPAGTGPLTTVAGQPALEDTDPTQTAPDTGAAEAERAPRRRTRTARTARAGTGAR